MVEIFEKSKSPHLESIEKLLIHPRLKEPWNVDPGFVSFVMPIK